MTGAGAEPHSCGMSITGYLRRGGLVMIAEGIWNKEIADRPFLGQSTVKTQSRDRALVVAYAHRRGYGCLSRGDRFTEGL